MIVSHTLGKVSELVGRLSALQGDCASAQVQRRISETYGERASAYRVTNRVLQSQANWGAIERAEKGRRLVRLESIAVSDERAVAWLFEAALCYMGRPVSLASLSSLAALYPFAFKQPLAYVASKSPRLELTPVLHKKFDKSASRASIAGSKRVLRNVSRSHRWCDRIIADTTAVTVRRALSVSRDSFPQWAAKREVFATVGLRSQGAGNQCVCWRVSR